MTLVPGITEWAEDHPYLRGALVGEIVNMVVEVNIGVEEL